MSEKKTSTVINLCASGDVTSPKTWSGTPFNIYSELKKKHAVGVIINLHNSVLFHRFAKLLSFINYFNDQDSFRGQWVRFISSRIVSKRLKRASSPHTLHFGTLGFSLSHFPAGQFHYLYIDSTWALRAAQTAFMEKYSGRLIADAELLEADSYYQSKHIFTISQYVKQNLITHYKVPEQKITAVGTGVGVIQPFFGQKDYGNGKILFVAKGRFEDKGGALVINAFKKALAVNPGLTLSIVGQKVYADITDHPRIKTYGFIPLPQLQEMFESHSLFVMPAIYEPWGLVYLEALICKMPVVGLNRNSFPEISNYGTFGFIIDQPDEDALAKTLIDAFDDPTRLQQMGNAGQEYVLKNFTWEVAVDKIVDKINSFS